LTSSAGTKDGPQQSAPDRFEALARRLLAAEAAEQVWHDIQVVNAQLLISGLPDHIPISPTRTIVTRPPLITDLVRQRRSCMNVDTQPQ
jgi:hypothetical protein